MKNTDNLAFSETKKTVIFLHDAVSFKLDQKITDDAVFIKKVESDLEGSGMDILYYVDAIREAALSDKNIIIMDFEYIIGVTIDTLMKVPGQYNFLNWHFYTFFHADTTPPNEKEHKMYNDSDEKYTILWDLLVCPMILKYALPVGHIVTYEELKQLMDFFKTPENVKSIEELMRYKPKSPFPFYEEDYKRLKTLIDERQR